MATLTSTEQKRLERSHGEGIGSAAVVAAFRAKGERFSAATLRKYVQLGLLPKSQRVGAPGRHKGSSGVYPIEVVGLVNEIKRALDAGATLEQVRASDFALRAEVAQVMRAGQALFRRLDEALAAHPDKSKRPAFGAEVKRGRKSFEGEMRKLEKLAARMGVKPVAE